MSSANPITLIEYRPVVGFPLYRVGNDGSVWSRIARDGRRSFISDRWTRMSGFVNPIGYLAVSLLDRLRGKLHTRKVHRLVLEAFVGPCPKGMHCLHGPDQSKTNNNLQNLRWGTPLENAADKTRNGRDVRGSAFPQAKLTEDDIPVIRQMKQEGRTARDIAAIYHIHPNTVHKIVKREKWKHVG